MSDRLISDSQRSLMREAFEKLKESEQADFFLTINKEQKSVDPNLLWDLLQK